MHKGCISTSQKQLSSAVLWYVNCPIRTFPTAHFILKSGEVPCKAPLILGVCWIPTHCFWSRLNPWHLSGFRFGCVSFSHFQFFSVVPCTFHPSYKIHYMVRLILLTVNAIASFLWLYLIIIQTQLHKAVVISLTSRDDTQALSYVVRFLCQSKSCTRS